MSSETPQAFFLPETEVPDLEFAGIRAQYAALKDAIAPRIAEVFRHGRFIMGPEIEALEDALCDFCGAGHAVAVSSGTDALVAPLMALGVGPGDAVFVPGFTFTATAEVVLLLGAMPVFVDVDGASFNLDPASLERSIARVRAEGALTPKAVIAVDLFGLPADYEALARIAGAEGLNLIADAAQSFGARRGNRKVGTLAPVTTTSFYPAKPLGCYGDGGAVLTDDPEMAALLRSIRVHGQGSVQYAVERVGLNARLDSFQAAVLLGKLPAFEGEVAARNRLADRYDAGLGAVVQTPARFGCILSSWAQYSILTDDRDGLRARLGEAGIPTAVYYPEPMHLQPAYRDYGGGEGSLPVSEALCGRIVSLPMHAYMRDETADRIIEAVRAAV
ncbi:MAG: DegT/DnrJ/EryC1/StrS family aminotransferase [Rhodospirillaceae bacterium]|nr:DegT/DnrJ/EryC1/StrS family aminotransferase [Rhodospirillaceae bacterium]